MATIVFLWACCWLAVGWDSCDLVSKSQIRLIIATGLVNCELADCDCKNGVHIWKYGKFSINILLTITILAFLQQCSLPLGNNVPFPAMPLTWPFHIPRRVNLHLYQRPVMAWLYPVGYKSTPCFGKCEGAGFLSTIPSPPPIWPW